MKILDWNVCAFSRDQAKVIEKALNFGADIMCLQEVSGESLEILKKAKGYNIAYTNDSDSDKGGYYIATLTKFPILSTGTVEYYTKRINSPTVRLIKWYSKESEVHKSVYVDFKTEGKIVRLYNIHTSWAVTPSVRMEQFSNFTKAIKDHPHTHIISGDLNVFGGLKYYNILVSILFGYKRKDIFGNERAWFDKKFKQMKLQNPFKGTISWPLIPFNAQLDHVLVPNDMEIKKTFQSKKTFGSDHTPYVLEVSL